MLTRKQMTYDDAMAIQVSCRTLMAVSPGRFGTMRIVQVAFGTGFRLTSISGWRSCKLQSTVLAGEHA